MSFLNQVTSGKVKQPLFVCIYGVDGIGKSTFAAQAPKPIFIGPEKGTAKLDVARMPAPKSYKDLLAMLDELAKAEHPYLTLALDSLDWIEPLLHDEVLNQPNNSKCKSIDDVGGGWEKGHKAALPLWRTVLSKIERLREERNMHVVLIAHAAALKFKDPQQQADYDRYQLKIHKEAASLVREAVDYVLFANHDIVTTKDETKKTRAYGGERRVLFTERRPGFDAKSRVALPIEMDFTLDSWREIYEADLAAVGETPEQIIARIKGFTDLMPLEALPKIEESIEAAKNDVPRLEQILTRVKALASAS